MSEIRQFCTAIGSHYLVPEAFAKNLDGTKI